MKYLTIKNRHTGQVRDVAVHVWDYMKRDGRSRDYHIVETNKMLAKKFEPAKTEKEVIEIKPIGRKRKSNYKQPTPTSTQYGETD